MNEIIPFKKKFSYELRKNQSDQVKNKYPNRVPVIVEKKKNDKHTPDIDKNKYLVPIDLTISNFICIIRKRMKIKPDQAIFIFVDNVLPPNSSLIGSIYNEHSDNDGFLYITYASEATFG